MIRKSLLLALAAALPLSLGACARLAPTSPAEMESAPFTFVHITDPQIGAYIAFKQSDDFSNEERDLARATALVAEIQPDFVVIGGDLVETWNNEEEIALFKDFLGELEEVTHVYVQPGNHDHPPTAEGIAFYRETYGADYYTVRHRGTELILLNTNMIAFPDRMAEEEAAQWEWLEEQLRGAAERQPDNLFVLGHHPYFLERPDEEDTYFNIPPETRARYLNLFAEHGVDAIFAGHFHREAGGFMGDMEMIVTSSVGTPLGEQPPGLRVVHVTPDGYEHEYVPLP